MSEDVARKDADSTCPSYGAAAVTPSDSVQIFHTRGLYIGVAGNVKCTMVNGNVVTFVGVLAGTILPVQVELVWATGTTASSIVALY
jgi:hypothetical protein